MEALMANQNSTEQDNDLQGLEQSNSLLSEQEHTQQRAVEVIGQSINVQSEAEQLSFSTTDVLDSQWTGLIEQVRDRSSLHRAGVTSRLAQTEEMLQETMELLNKRTEMVCYLERKGVQEERQRQDSLQQLRSCQEELIISLEHMQLLRETLCDAQHKAEERRVAVHKLTTELREAQGQLDQTRKEMEDKDKALTKTESKWQQTSKEMKSLTKRLEFLQGQLHEKEKMVKSVSDQTRQLQDCSEELHHTRTALQHKHTHCRSLNLQLQVSDRVSREKESEVRRLKGEMDNLKKRAADDESRLYNTLYTHTQDLQTLRNRHLEEKSHTDILKASDLVVSTLQNSQLHLGENLEKCQTQLGQAIHESAALLAELSECKQLLQFTSNDLQLKESEIAHLKSTLANMDRIRLLLSPAQCPDFSCSVTKTPHCSSQSIQQSVKEDKPHTHIPICKPTKQLKSQAQDLNTCSLSLKDTREVNM